MDVWRIMAIKYFMAKKKDQTEVWSLSLILSRYLTLHRAHFINPVSKRLR